MVLLLGQHDDADLVGSSEELLDEGRNLLRSLSLNESFVVGVVVAFEEEVVPDDAAPVAIGLLGILVALDLSLINI